MGNQTCCGTRKEVHRESSFSEPEMKHLKALFKQFADSEPETWGTDGIGKNAFKEMFLENTTLAAKIYKFMKRCQQDGSTKVESINFETFVASIEVLTTEQSEKHTFKYKRLGKHFILATIYSGDPELTTEKAFKTHKVSYSDAVGFVKCILKIYQHNKYTIHEVDDVSAKVVCDAVFDANHSDIDWWTLLFFIRQNLIFINTSILFYFRIKFLNRSQPLLLPEMSVPSALISNDTLALFALSNLHIQDTPKLSLLFSSAQNGFDFPKLVNALRHLGPTLILLGHTKGGSDANDKKSAIFGGFANKTWNDNARSSKDDRSYVFSVYPQFRNFFHRTRTDEAAHANFTFLNTDYNRSKQVGIGFGGKADGEFRLWIDANIKSKSYVRDEDGTYDKGPLIPFSVRKLTIDFVEVWGLQPSVKNSEVLNITTATRHSVSPAGSALLRSNKPERASYSNPDSKTQELLKDVFANFDLASASKKKSNATPTSAQATESQKFSFGTESNSGNFLRRNDQNSTQKESNSYQQYQPQRNASNKDGKYSTVFKNQHN